MFDAVTAQLLRSAPALSGLDPNDIPQLLTLHYAQLVSARLAASAGEDGATATEQWPLEKIADAYELITSIHDDPSVRRASAFVAGTAQQILARKISKLPESVQTWNIERDSVDPAVSAALLFLAAEQYADANEAALGIKPNVEGQPYEITILAEHVRDLAKGDLTSISERAGRWRIRRRQEIGLEERALIVLVDALIRGVELLSARMLSASTIEATAGSFGSARDAFVSVMNTAARSSDTYAAELGGSLLTMYSGPRHMASLLLAASDGISDAALTAIPPPDGADSEFWQKWIAFRATKFPFVWRNHREAIEQGFHLPGLSAVVVLPTGAGKTTISSLKIASTLALGKKVAFLAPTHALVEQLTGDLQEMFPKELVGSVVSSDFDLLLLSGSQLQEIEVMTPERCLAMLSFAPAAFSEVGLLVFDECHLLSPQSGKIRRSLDAMLCVLAFNHVAPNADMLFLSAMLKNGDEFGKWVEQLTGRKCCCVDLLWKLECGRMSGDSDPTRL
jgi:DEAD/DEAH box helicase